MVYPIRIGIANRTSSARIAVWSPGAVWIDFTPIFELKPKLVYLIQDGKIVEYATGRSCVLPTDKRARISASDFRIWCNNRWWAGTLELIQFSPHSMTVINLLDTEDYLRGVVPSEMPASWNLEALKAQAVAARSYASAHMEAGSKWWKSEGYDLVPDVRDQAYKGLAAQARSTDMAVSQTCGLILKDSGRVKPGFYRAEIGDAQENLNIRSKVVPSSLLERLTGVSNILGVTVRAWDEHANARDIQIMGKKQTREVSGIDLAKRLGLATAGVLDVKEAGDNWIFTYRGPGNGSLGLSQHGANMFANRGWKFHQILQQYYQDPDGRLRLDIMDKYKMFAAQRNSAAAQRARSAKAAQAQTKEAKETEGEDN